MDRQREREKQIEKIELRSNKCLDRSMEVELGMEEILPYLFMTDRQTDPIQTTNQQTDINIRRKFSLNASYF